jgi:hypothetical protein
MTRVTSRVGQLVIVVDVAGLAGSRRVCTRQRKFGCAVIERCRFPRRGRMTRLTILAEVVRHVIWIRGTVEIGAVALVTA